jgi:hypothetical protein
MMRFQRIFCSKGSLWGIKSSMFLLMILKKSIVTTTVGRSLHEKYMFTIETPSIDGRGIRNNGYLMLFDNEL